MNDFGWSLPPGVSQGDIDRAFGGVSRCTYCGREMEATDAEEPVCYRCGRDPDYDRESKLP